MCWLAALKHYKYASNFIAPPRSDCLSLLKGKPYFEFGVIVSTDVFRLLFHIYTYPFSKNCISELLNVMLLTTTLSPTSLGNAKTHWDSLAWKTLIPHFTGLYKGRIMYPPPQCQSKKHPSLAGVAQLVGGLSHKPKCSGFDSQSGDMPRFAGQSPGQGACRQPIDVSLPLCPSLPPPLS